MGTRMEERKKAKNTPAYETINNEIRHLCRQEKEKWCNDKCDQIEQHRAVTATKKFHESIKELIGKRNSKPAGNCIKSKEGKMIFERDKVLERWSEYIGDLFADDRPPLPTPNNDRGPPNLKTEVEKAIRESQMGKLQGKMGSPQRC